MLPVFFADFLASLMLFLTIFTVKDSE